MEAIECFIAFSNYILFLAHSIRPPCKRLQPPVPVIAAERRRSAAPSDRLRYLNLAEKPPPNLPLFFLLSTTAVLSGGLHHSH